MAVHEVFLQRREEALGDGVIPAVADAAHAHADPVGRERVEVVASGVLAASIGVMQQAATRLAAQQSFLDACDLGVEWGRLCPP